MARAVWSTRDRKGILNLYTNLVLQTDATYPRLRFALTVFLFTLLGTDAVFGRKESKRDVIS
jgi:hypothetical protein